MTAAIEDDGRNQTATNGALYRRILRTALSGAGVAIGMHNAASKCKLAFGHAIELRVYMGQKFNGMPLCKLHLLAALCTPMAAVQVLTLSNLRWWCFSSTI